MIIDLNIIEDLIPRGRKNRPGRINPMRFITIHETDNTRIGAGAKNHANYLKTNVTIVQEGTLKSWHYTVDDKETYRHIPEEEDAFHAGPKGGAGNRESIGIEICVNADGMLLLAIDRAAILTADICMRRGIPFENIRQHFDWSRKNCPRNIRAGLPVSWLQFIQKVRECVDLVNGITLPGTTRPARLCAPLPSTRRFVDEMRHKPL